MWSFFATSHGNSHCGAIGGTMKRKIARESLQIPITKQVLIFKVVEEFCKEKIVGINFFSIYNKDMEHVTEILDARYLLGDTITGKTSCHNFEPLSATSIKGKQLSNEYL